MTKLKTPLFGLEAHGSLASTITLQRRKPGTFVRTKPSPKDPKTLAQIYQRWDYQDYLYQWTQLSDAAKFIWESAARKHHITGLNLFMRDRLNTLPDLVARWRMDEASGSTIYDSSKNAYHGTIYGPTHLPGYISNCLSFDGIDDYTSHPNYALLDFTTEDFTIEFWINPTLDTHRTIMGNMRAVYDRGWWLRLVLPDQIRLSQCNAGAIIETRGSGITAAEWQHIIIERKQPNLGKVYRNSINITTLSLTTDIKKAEYPFRLGDITGIFDLRLGAMLDQIAIYNRILDATERQRHYERNYPL